MVGDVCKKTGVSIYSNSEILLAMFREGEIKLEPGPFDRSITGPKPIRTPQKNYSKQLQRSSGLTTPLPPLFRT